MPSEYKQTQQAFRQKMGGALDPRKQAVHMLREKALFDPMKAAKGASEQAQQAADIATTTAGQLTGAIGVGRPGGEGQGIYSAAQDRARQQQVSEAASQAAAEASSKVSEESAARIAQQASESEAAALKAAEIAPTPAKDALKVVADLALTGATGLAGLGAVGLGSKLFGDKAMQNYLKFKHGSVPGTGDKVVEEEEVVE